MNVRVKLSSKERMTVDEFLAFYDMRPTGEKWELVDGIAVMSPSPTDVHQLVVTNIVTALMVHKERSGALWLPMPGIGTRVPVAPPSLPQPDVFVKQGAISGLSVTDDALVVFEVLSRSNTKADQTWRRKVYSSVANCQHYVTISLKRVEAVAFDRATGWQERRIADLDASLDLPALPFALRLASIYRWTSLESARPT